MYCARPAVVLCLCMAIIFVVQLGMCVMNLYKLKIPVLFFINFPKESDVYMSLKVIVSDK